MPDSPRSSAHKEGNSGVQRDHSKPCELLRKGPAQLPTETHLPTETAGSPHTAGERPPGHLPAENTLGRFVTSQQPITADQVNIPFDYQGSLLQNSPQRG